MSNGMLTKAGTLRKKFLPAAYFDSSVLIDYWVTEGLEVALPEGSNERMIAEQESEDFKVVKKILKSDERTETMIEVRKKLLFEQLRVTPIISPLCLLELMEWNAEAAFKETASQAVGYLSIQRKSKKDIGDYLKRLLEMMRKEVKEQKGKKREYSTGLEIIMSNTWLDRGFAQCHGLQGLTQVDIVNLNLTVDKIWHEPSAYAYLQLGISDIIHILIAQHLGCSYIASFDSDFKRVEDIIREETGMKLLGTPREILETL